MPSSEAARTIRVAISPRLAAINFSKGGFGASVALEESHAGALEWKLATDPAVDTEPVSWLSKMDSATRVEAAPDRGTADRANRWRGALLAAPRTKVRNMVLQNRQNDVQSRASSTRDVWFAFFFFFVLNIMVCSFLSRLAVSYQ